MDKRTYERVPANLQAKLFVGNIIYTGIVSNLSENGMFICTRKSFPVDSMFAIALLRNGQSFKVSVKVRRIARSFNHYASSEDNGIGVMLVNPPQDYIEFVSKCKVSHDSSRSGQ